MATVTVGCCVAVNYAEFVPGWLESVQGLTRQPDEVVVVTDITGLPDWVRVVPPPQPTWDGPAWHRTLYAACTTDWVSWVNADDRYQPWALDDWPEWSDVDIAVMGNQVWLGHDDVESILRCDYNHITCGSPIRLAAYNRGPGIPDHLMPFGDWATFVGMVATGSVPRCTGRVDYIYRVHPETETALEPTRGLIREWLKSL